MSPDTINLVLQGLQDIAGLAVASGAVTAAIAFLRKKGIDVIAVQNSKLVQAAENGAQAAVLDLIVKGKSLTDPAVLSDVTLALKASLQGSHADTAAAIGASAADIERVASNAIGKTVLAVTGSAAASALPVAANDVTSQIADAAKVIADAQAAIARITLPVPSRAASAPVAPVPADQAAAAA